MQTILFLPRCIAEKVARGQTWKATCSVGTRPDLSIIELELASLFGTGIAMSSWTWTSNTLQTWQKLWRRYYRMFAAHQGWENSPIIALNSNLTLNYDELSSCGFFCAFSDDNYMFIW